MYKSKSIRIIFCIYVLLVGCRPYNPIGADIDANGLRERWEYKSGYAKLPIKTDIGLVYHRQLTMAGKGDLTIRECFADRDTIIKGSWSIEEDMLVMSYNGMTNRYIVEMEQIAQGELTIDGITYLRDVEYYYAIDTTILGYWVKNNVSERPALAFYEGQTCYYYLGGGFSETRYRWLHSEKSNKLCLQAKRTENNINYQIDFINHSYMRLSSENGVELYKKKW